LWGEHEWTLYPQPFHPDFPYLPWILLPPCNSSHDILHCAVNKKMWQPHASKTNMHLVQPEVLDKLKTLLGAAKAAIEVPFHEVITSFSFHHPQHAYTRAFEAIDCLEREFDAWRDFMEVFRNMQCSLLELFAFAGWWVEYDEPTFCAPMWGTIFYNETCYAAHIGCSITSFLLIPSATYTLDPCKQVELVFRQLRLICGYSRSCSWWQCELSRATCHIAAPFSQLGTSQLVAS
jgi:hypothetical protein